MGGIYSHSHLIGNAFSRAFEYRFYDLAFGVVGIALWLWVSMLWKDRALILLNGVSLFMLMTALFSKTCYEGSDCIFIMKDHTSYEQTEREELQADIASGSLKDKDVTFYNAGECELSWDTNYYDLGKQVKSWTEINGMVSEHAASLIPTNPFQRDHTIALRDSSPNWTM